MSRDSQYIHKSHNVTVLLYHIVSSAKYRWVVISSEVDKILVSVCEEIEKRYEIRFLEIGTDKDHVHFLIQSVPSYSVTKIVRTIKSLIAKEVFKQCWLFRSDSASVFGSNSATKREHKYRLINGFAVLLF